MWNSPTLDSHVKQSKEWIEYEFKPVIELSISFIIFLITYNLHMKTNINGSIIKMTKKFYVTTTDK